MRLALAIPAYGDIKHATAQSIWRFTSQLGANQIEFDEICHNGDPDLARARNGILNAFLRTESDRLFFIDTDMSFDPLDAWKLVSSKLDYVGADYCQKGNGRMACTRLERGASSGSCVEAKMLATGLMCLSRKAVQLMADKSESYVSDDGLTCKAITHSGVSNGYWRSEDEVMCRKWQDLGQKAWIDTSINVGHVGQFEYRATKTPPQKLVVGL